MSPTLGQTVSEIVEKYMKQYPDTERKALRKLILLRNKGINPRTLDRHLRKAFERGVKKPSTEEKHSNEYSDHIKELEEIETLGLCEWSIDSAWQRLLLLHTHLPPKLKADIWERLRRIVYDYHPGNYKYGKHDILDLKEALDIVYEALEKSRAG
jgi:hypothetical protein